MSPQPAQIGRVPFAPLIEPERGGVPAGFAEPIKNGREHLTSLLEAARWAPSCNGDEPWRYLIWDRSRSPEGWQKAFECLSENNKKWVKNVPMLMLSCAAKSCVTTTSYRTTGPPTRPMPTCRCCSMKSL